MNSSRTFKRSQSTASSSFPPHHPPYVPKKTPLVEFPASPQLILGEEIVHFSHPHPLSKIDLPDLYTCAGCKEYGAGKRFTCQQCDYQLHEFCGLAPQTLKGHPLHYQHQLAFLSKPVKSGIAKSKCDVCAKPIKGYRFRCVACPFRMHPSCEMLQDEVIFPSHPHALRLLPSTAQASSAGDSAGFMCGECGRKRSGRVYRCTGCDYHLHAVCAKGAVNGLYDNGIKGLEKPGMLVVAAKLASRVVVDFIGGLIEGIGESVGEVLVQNVARGRCYSRRRAEE
ncbi:hypothetical protein CRG98_040557 [Punica granatum]|nr:hypothetical protein CRG98_040557 [Punica granatum]